MVQSRWRHVGYTIPDRAADIEVDEAASDVYDFVRENEGGFYGVPDEPGVALAEIGKELDLEPGQARRSLAKLREAGLLEREVHVMDELAIDAKLEYDAITEHNDQLPDGEFDRVYAIDDVYSTTDVVSETDIINGLME